jgi:hypothetical protein
MMGWSGTKKDLPRTEELAIRRAEEEVGPLYRTNAKYDAAEQEWAVYGGAVLKTGAHAGRRIGVVVLIRKGYDPGWSDVKVMSEDMGPYYYGARPSLLVWLENDGPAFGESSAKWREICKGKAPVCAADLRL